MDLAFEYGMNFFETSAKKNINVTEAFICFAKSVKKRIVDGLLFEPLETFKLYYERKSTEINLIEFFKTSSCLPSVLYSIIIDYYISDDLSDYYSSSVSGMWSKSPTRQQPKRKDSTCMVM